MTLFIVKDAAGNLLTKELLWTRESTTAELFSTPHRDIALNQLLELNAGNITFRAEIVTCPADDKNRPVLNQTQDNQTAA